MRQLKPVKAPVRNRNTHDKVLKSVVPEDQKAKFQVYKSPVYGDNTSGISNSKNALDKIFPNCSYDDLLSHNKRSLLKRFNTKQLASLVNAMGGPKNFSRHFCFSKDEIEVLFPPVKKPTKEITPMNKS